MILSNNTNLLIACSGEPDVLPPALAIADELRRQIPAARPIFTGDTDSAQYRRITNAGFEYRSPESDPSSIQGAVLRRFGAMSIERQFLRRCDASAVISLGGRLGESLGRAAATIGMPVVAFEPRLNASGPTQRLASVADLLCLAFSESRDNLTANCPIRVTGMPVRRFNEAASAAESECNTDNQPVRRLVVLAGSDNCDRLNGFLPAMFDSLRPILRQWRIIHQTRRDEVRSLKHTYGRLRLNAVATSYIHKLPQILSTAELVISDMDPTSIDELAASAPPIVVAAQSGSAEPDTGSLLTLLDQQGACVVVPDCEGSSDLATQVAPLLQDQRRRAELSAAFRSHFRPDAAWLIADAVRELIKRG